MPVEDRSEATLLPIIREWIEPGTLIVSDCWKSYSKLSENGYLHETVNHSKEFVNSNGFNTNKQEGHWRHMKTSLPIFGTRKQHFWHIWQNLCGVISINTATRLKFS